MRIAFITFEYPPHIVGGAGTYAQHVVRGLADLGHEVVVFTPLTSGHEDRSNVEMVEVPVMKRLPFTALQFWLSLPAVFKRSEKSRGFDIVHFNGTSYWFLRKITSSPQVVTIHHLAKDSMDHDGIMGMVLSLVERRAVDSSARVVAVSEYTRQRIIEGLAVDPDKVGRVYGGGSYDPSATADVAAAERLLSGFEGKKKVLFVGRVDDRRKGLDVLIRAMKNVLNEHDAVLVVAGKGDRGINRKLVEETGLGGHILFTGFVDDHALLGLYRICDVYVCPSRLEGFGLTILDAQRFSPYVVATRIGPIPEIASERTILVEKEDVEGLAKAIERCLDGEIRVPEQYVAQSNTTPVFSWEDAAEKLIAQYQLAIDGHDREKNKGIK